MKHLIVIAMIVIAAGLGFNYGVEHEVKQKFSTTPLYTSRVVISHGNDKAILWTAAKCDSLQARSDGWWANRYLVDAKSTIVVEMLEWPYDDQCK